MISLLMLYLILSENIYSTETTIPLKFGYKGWVPSISPIHKFMDDGKKMFIWYVCMVKYQECM